MFKKSKISLVLDFRKNSLYIFSTFNLYLFQNKFDYILSIHIPSILLTIFSYISIQSKNSLGLQWQVCLLISTNQSNICELVVFKQKSPGLFCLVMMFLPDIGAELVCHYGMNLMTI